MLSPNTTALRNTREVTSQIPRNTGSSANSMTRPLPVLLTSKEADRLSCFRFSSEIYPFSKGFSLYAETVEYGIFEGLRKQEFDKKEDAEKFLQNQKFYGITQFKKRFGGDFINYPGAIDKIYNPILYKCLNFLKIIRKTLRKILKVRI